MTENKGTDWMYNPVSEINRDEYLLGKKVGKDFDADGTMGKINDVEYDCTPGSIFASKAGHQVDIQRKILEDPLVSIKKREAEDRKKIMDNPIKMKALREHIEEMNSKKRKKKKKKLKGSDNDSDDDLDLKLLKKIQRMEQGGDEDDDDENVDKKKKKKKKHKSHEIKRKSSPLRKRRSRSRSTHDRRRSPSKSPRRRKRRSLSNSPPRRKRSPSSSPPRRKRRSPSNSPPKRKRRSPSNSPRRKSSPSSSPPKRKRRSPSDSPPRRKRSLSRSPPRRKIRSPSNSPPRKKRSPSHSPPRRRRSPESSRRRRSRSDSDGGRGKGSSSPREMRRERSVSPVKKTGGLDLLGRTHHKAARSPERKPVVARNSSSLVERRKGLTAEEKEARLAEMMKNASWRDEQRTARVTKHREEVGREEAEAEREHDKDFLTRELQRAQTNLTVEGRITANKYKIQRGHGDMDKNFARR